jgi:hypothetical protein
MESWNGEKCQSFLRQWYKSARTVWYTSKFSHPIWTTDPQIWTPQVGPGLFRPNNDLPILSLFDAMWPSKSPSLNGTIIFCRVRFYYLRYLNQFNYAELVLAQNYIPNCMAVQTKHDIHDQVKPSFHPSFSHSQVEQTAILMNSASEQLTSRSPLCEWPSRRSSIHTIAIHSHWLSWWNTAIYAIILFLYVVAKHSRVDYIFPCLALCLWRTLPRKHWVSRLQLNRQMAS